MAFHRGTARAALGLLAILALACRSLPEGAPEPPRVSVDPGGEAAPHRISAAVLPVTEETFRDTLSRAGVGLRVAGEREGVVLRFAALDPAAEGLLLRTFDVPEPSFSEPAGFAGSDVILVETIAGSPPTGMTMHILPRLDGETLTGMDLGVLVRPEDGTLLPVLRGHLPLPGSGAVLVTGESPGRRPFAAVLRIELAGAERIAAVNPPETHRFDVRSWSASSAALSRMLAGAGLPEKGGTAGLAVYRIGAGDVARVASALEAEGTAGAGEEREIRSGETCRVRLGDLDLALTPAFSLADYTYTTTVALEDHAGATPEQRTHGERDALLLLGWDAVAVGRSRAALLQLSPTD